MGDKKLKALCVLGTGSVKVADPERFMEVAYKAFQKIMKRPTAKTFRRRTLAGMIYTDEKRNDELWEIMHTTKNALDIHWPRERRKKLWV